MTGRFSIRSGTYEVPIGGVPDGLTQWEITIAQLLSATRLRHRHVGQNGTLAAPRRVFSILNMDLTNGTAFRAPTTRRSGRR